ncbi:MAG: hypothetical protein Q7R33_10095 [Nitrosarchaeum sp.]|nr:hypothetical protein [Nitrosarchaeum sp.]
MAHSEHNKSKNSGSFAMIILGAILLYLAPIVIYSSNTILGVIAFIGGIVIGGVGFYLKFIRTRVKKV